MPVVTTEGFRALLNLPDRLLVDIPLDDGALIVPGKGSRATGAAAARNVIECAGACLRGELRAMVTAPLHKKFLNEAGYAFPGHTELLASLTATREFAMAFLTDRLRVALATIHVSIREAIETITPGVIISKVSILAREFPRLGLPCGRIAVAGLNPHAGEGGLLGREEIEIVEPAVRRCREQFPGVDIQGPLPADTLFHRAVQGEFDAVLALYHDQGLIPVKLLGFGEAVNVTLGLPFIRTSVDHGTAYDLAGTGAARPDSLINALRWALRLVPN
jgi:4-hydroxythreonine-4-phosphate dehydrogenase